MKQGKKNPISTYSRSAGARITDCMSWKNLLIMKTNKNTILLVVVASYNVSVNLTYWQEFHWYKICYFSGEWFTVFLATAYPVKEGPISCAYMNTQLGYSTF